LPYNSGNTFQILTMLSE